MSTLKYTPGPWKIGVTTLSEANGTPIVSNLKRFNEEQEANYRLIAAAPDMYEALQALQGVEAWINNSEMSRLVSQTIERVMAKIES